MLQMHNPHLNLLSQAQAGSMFKGADYQQERFNKEKDQRMKVVFYKNQKEQELQKTSGTTGRLA